MPLRPPPSRCSITPPARPLPLSRGARRLSDARSASLTNADRRAAPVAGLVLRRRRATTVEPLVATEGGADPAGAWGAPSPPALASRRLFSFRTSGCSCTLSLRPALGSPPPLEAAGLPGGPARGHHGNVSEGARGVRTQSNTCPPLPARLLHASADASLALPTLTGAAGVAEARRGRRTLAGPPPPVQAMGGGRSKGGGRRVGGSARPLQRRGRPSPRSQRPPRSLGR